MNIFNRLFGKKPKNQSSKQPENAREIQPTKEKPDKANIVAAQKLQTDP